MAAYKTPGVYVEEIVKFPPSVAQVETAIPAFIGYTKKAEKKNGDGLTLVPTRITSLLEYETYFGSAQEEETITVSIADTIVDGNVERSYTVNKPSTPKPYLMYYSLQLYFANGGGPCYIVSVADYTTGVVTKAKLGEGLAKLRKVDEPTLIVFPDATNIGDTDEFYGLYNDALTQCNELQDRFTIIDTENDDEENKTPVQDLRDKISNDKDYVKYGAAYYPFLETILDYHYDETKVAITHTQDADATLADEETAAKAAVTAVVALEAAAGGLVTALDTINTDIQGGDAGNAVAKQSDAADDVQDIIDNLDSVLTEAGKAVTQGNAAGVTTEATALNTAITDAAGDFLKLKSDLETAKAAILAAANGTAVKPEVASANTTASTTVAKIQAVDALMDAVVSAISAAHAATTTPLLNGKKLNEVEAIDNAAYYKIKSAINSMPLKLPPSSAMAGIYARVDSDRGVWKAPANVSLNYVVKPSLQITHEEQRDLNVDTTAGKSINAIRSFTGKGTLVWGGRTLAGNDNEWRYISVRRFFNMAEESIKKATEQFVFEPNDKNTWVRVKAMINNFLTAQWRAGALAGPTPEKAFYVNIGLGETMTAIDILEGNMIVEIGMAVVRPAEFIILRFSHKMQEA